MSVMVGVCVVALVVMLTGCKIPFFSNLFADGDGISVTVGNTEYTQNATGLKIANDTTFTVKNADGYDVKIYAKDTTDDFTFVAGGITTQWSDAAGTDFTNGFAINKNGATFTVTYKNLSSVIASVLGFDSIDISASVIPAGDMLDMRITSEDKSISLCFTLADLYVDIEGLEIDKNGIIFGRC